MTETLLITTKEQNKIIEEKLKSTVQINGKQTKVNHVSEKCLVQNKLTTGRTFEVGQKSKFAG